MLLNAHFSKQASARSSRRGSSTPTKGALCRILLPGAQDDTCTLFLSGWGGLSAKGAEDREVDQNVVAMPVQLRGLLVDTAIDPEDRAQKRSGEGKLLAAEARQLGDF